MLIREARTVLRSMLDGAGLSTSGVTAADVPATVEVFRRFAALPVDRTVPRDEDGDGVLAQFGTYAVGDQRQFSADLTRQFIQAGRDDAAIWQLSCTFHWPASPETDVLSAGYLWSFGPDLDEFFTAAVALPGWAWALGTSEAPRDFTIALSEV